MKTRGTVEEERTERKQETNIKGRVFAMCEQSYFLFFYVLWNIKMDLAEVGATSTVQIEIDPDIIFKSLFRSRVLIAIVVTCLCVILIMTHDIICSITLISIFYIFLYFYFY